MYPVCYPQASDLARVAAGQARTVLLMSPSRAEAGLQPEEQQAVTLAALQVGAGTCQSP